MKSLGRHILVEFMGCSSEVLNDVTKIEKGMVDAAQKAGATVINSTFHHFSPYGVSGVVVIQESHLAIHTWPEYQYAAVDLFTCGESVDPWNCFDALKKVFKAQTHSAIEMNRGSLSLLTRANFKIDIRTGTTKKEYKSGEIFKRNLWFTDKDANQALSLRYGELLFQEKTPFQNVRIFDTVSYGKMLTVDNMIMCTERDEYHYHEMIVHPLMQLHGSAKKILVIGGGDGGTIRELFKYDHVEKVVMVEIDEAVIRASKMHLPTIASSFDHPKLELKIDDGIKFVENSPAGEYDLIIVDGSDPEGPAQGLFTTEFYSNCMKALKQNGALITQGESPMFYEKTFAELNKCLKTVFGQDHVHTMLFFASTYPSGMWSLHMAIKGQYHPVKDFNKDKAMVFAKEKGLKYYNEDIHCNAFALPTFVKKMLAEV